MAALSLRVNFVKGSKQNECTGNYCRPKKEGKSLPAADWKTGARSEKKFDNKEFQSQDAGHVKGLDCLPV